MYNANTCIFVANANLSVLVCARIACRVEAIIQFSKHDMEIYEFLNESFWDRIIFRVRRSFWSNRLSFALLLWWPLAHLR